MSTINYSKWDNIEISDDEDDTHPNVDTASLFKWRHEARVQRKEEEEAEKKKRQTELKLQERRIAELEKRKAALAADEGDAAKAQLKGVEEELAEIAAAHAEYLRKEEELERWQREHPKWDVDNIGQETKSRTVINGYKETKKPDSKPEDDVDDMMTWFRKYGDDVQKYAALTTSEQSHKFLVDNLHLVSDHMASYLVIYCVDLEVEGLDKEVKVAARQTITMQYILELAKSIKRDPRECVNAFFARLATADGEYKAAFDDEVNSLIQRVKKRAVDRRVEAEEKIKRERLGPGGLDPLEVLESLPESIKDAFSKQDTPALQKAFADLPPEEAKYHYDRVVQSGLWVPAGGAAGGEDDDEGAESDEEDAKAEPAAAAEGSALLPKSEGRAAAPSASATAASTSTSEHAAGSEASAEQEEEEEEDVELAAKAATTEASTCSLM